MDLERNTLAHEICDRLDSKRHEIRRQWEQSAPVRHFVVDDVLPDAWAGRIRTAFPDGRAMTLRRSLRERKYVAAQMNRYDPLLEESIYAFQMPSVVERVGQITEITALEPDHMLYAGGISVMSAGHFLNPHIDNSHDKTRQRYRVLNLLYYVSPQWPEDRGGNLELWQDGPTGKPTTIASRFNRLVVMITSRDSWHSVSRNHAGADRCCVSNYYFSPHPIDGEVHYHVTSYRGRPEQPVRDVALRADNWLRTMIRTRLPGAFKNAHFYDRQRSGQESNSVDAPGRAPPGHGGQE
jgi:Rps23 Pro-64 3,4-dihydroxylase Tpa1-like proline 4-hydroxylase